jgi:hypothetical protein
MVMLSDQSVPLFKNSIRSERDVREAEFTQTCPSRTILCSINFHHQTSNMKFVILASFVLRRSCLDTFVHATDYEQETEYQRQAPDSNDSAAQFVVMVSSHGLLDDLLDRDTDLLDRELGLVLLSRLSEEPLPIGQLAS